VGGQNPARRGLAAGERWIRSVGPWLSFGDFGLVSKQSQSILVTARLRGWNGAAISDGIERGCRGRETANLRFPGFQPFGAPSAKLARATQPTKLPHFLAKTRRVGSVFPDPVESFLDGRI